MKMIIGLAAPTAGAVTIGGRRYRDLPVPLTEVGALLDAGAVHGARTAYDHLLALAVSNGLQRRRVDEVLARIASGCSNGYRADRACKHSAGAGSGLAIARSIARAHGGDLAVHTALGRGAVFALTLPLLTSGELDVGGVEVGDA
ncbi:ATP-binding protein [Kribbella sp. NPDC059898]|uniref:ATP-binding protein n=1 Tax=Kribbella sp. NPDC059898 TaxID=3346995 RepID=UPI0036502A1F